MNRTFQFRCTAELFSKEKPGARIIDLQGTEHFVPNECEWAVEWEEEKKPAKEKKTKPAKYDDRLSAWMEKPHPKPAPLPVEKREQLSFGF
jgi:hypothetical protein